MRKIYYLLLLLVLLIPAPVSGKIIKSQNVNIKAGQVVNDDVFVTADTIKINGIINGDLYAAGGQIDIDGKINGDIYAVGGTINLAGDIKDDVIVAGGNINVFKAKINDSLMTFGGMVNVDKQSTIAGNVIFGAGSYQSQARVNRGMLGGAGNADLNGIVNRDIYLAVENLSFGDQFNAKKNITYRSSQKAIVDKSAKIGGEMKFIETSTKQTPREIAVSRVFASTGFKIFSFLSALLVGILLLRFFENKVKLITGIIEKKSWPSLGWGFISLIMAIPALFILAITLIGFPLALILFAIFLIEIYLTKIFFAVAVGNLLNRSLKLNSNNNYLVFATGLALYYILQIIPFFSFFVSVTSLFLGFGAMFLAQKQYLFPDKK